MDTYNFNLNIFYVYVTLISLKELKTYKLNPIGRRGRADEGIGAYHRECIQLNIRWYRFYIVVWALLEIGSHF